MKHCHRQTLSCFQANPGFVGEAPKRIGVRITGRQMEQLLFTPEEVAHVLHISRRKMYALMQSGEIESVKIGRCRRISRSALDRFVAKLTDEVGV